MEAPKKQMVTLINKDIEKMDGGELKREIKVQKYLLRRLNKERVRYEYLDENSNKPTTTREDKMEFFRNYEKAVRGLIAYMEWLLPRRLEWTAEPREYLHPATRKAHRKEADKRREALIAQKHQEYAYMKHIGSDGISLSWDKDKFFLLARDRGYQTEEAVYAVIGDALRIQRHKVVASLQKGRFTWGQVLVIGATFEMKPKEFCDIFLSGYFVEAYGDYIASTENLDVDALLKVSMMPKIDADTANKAD